MTDPLLEAGVALVTGAGSALDGILGIGQHIALHFAKKGCSKLFLVDIAEAGLQETESIIRKNSPHANITLHKTDVSNETSVKAMVDECITAYGRLDFACNNAGIAMSNLLTTETDLVTFEKVHMVNFKGVFLCQKYEIQAMLPQDPLKVERAARGSIVNTASLSGVATLGQMSTYHSSKHAVVSMTRVDARQYGEQGIRVNCVCPGVVETPLLEKSNLSKEWYDIAKAQCPMNRLIHPSEIAEGVMFLHGSGASSVTGIHLPLDGGALLYHVI